VRDTEDEHDVDRPAGDLPDERLRLVCTTCHPALAPASRVALTLRYAAGLPTAEVARLFHVSEPTMAARLTRAKQKIAAAGIPYAVPAAADLPARLAGVLDVVYLVFTAGHAPARGDRVVRDELCAEAIRLGRLVRALVPRGGEVDGLLALMLLTHARTPARTGPDGEVVLLPDQDRGRWDRVLLAEGRALVPGGDGPFALQAQIAARHADDPADWRAIAELYERLERVRPVPAVRLNRAVAVAEAAGPHAGLALLDGLDPALGRTHGLHLARAELLVRAGDHAAAADAFARAEQLAGNEAVRAHITGRRTSVGEAGRRP
jgi:RNA polymerase sigma-70 factor (ECF subfamily)